MADTPASNVDTEGTAGHTGTVPVGTAATSGSVADTEGTAPGGAPNPAAPAATPPDTSGTNSSNLPSNYHPSDVSVTGNADTASSDGNIIRQANPSYRAPAAYVAAGVTDTTRTDTLGVGPAPAETQSLYAGTIETGNIGAGTTAKTVTENLTLDLTGHTLTKAGVLPTATVTVVNKGQIIAVTGESHVGHTASDFTLTNSGVTSSQAQLVVKKAGTTLTLGSDYTATATGSGGTANFNIRLLTGGAHSVVDGDTVTVDYSYGNAKYFANATLTATTDYTKTYTGDGANTTLKITRVNTAASSNGDTVAVTYSYGDATYWGSNPPSAVPGAPTIGAVTAINKGVTVNWTAPSGNTDITSYIVQCVPGYGTKEVPANALKTNFTQLQAGVPYKFQVAARNARGMGAWSALSSAATPLNTDEVPTGSLDPANTVNPIYLPDGTIKAGTGLGPS